MVVTITGARVVVGGLVVVLAMVVIGVLVAVDVSDLVLLEQFEKIRAQVMKMVVVVENFLMSSFPVNN